MYAILKYFAPIVSPSRSSWSKRFLTSSSPSSSITFLEFESLMLSLSINWNGLTLHVTTFLMSPMVWTQTLWPCWHSTAAGPNQEFPFKGWYQTRSPSMKLSKCWYYWTQISWHSLSFCLILASWNSATILVKFSNVLWTASESVMLSVATLPLVRQSKVTDLLVTNWRGE